MATLLAVILEDINTPRYGYELISATGFASGKVHVILARLRAAGWLIREREDVDPQVVGRPARYYYRIDPDAVGTARTEVARLRQQLAPARPIRAVPQTGGAQ